MMPKKKSLIEEALPIAFGIFAGMVTNELIKQIMKKTFKQSSLEEKNRIIASLEEDLQWYKDELHKETEIDAKKEKG